MARRAGVATSSIRYYESIGVLPRAARLHGQRRYGPEVLGRLAFIAVAQSAGFKLSEIRELVHSADAAGGMADQMRSLSSRKLEEVEALLERTRAMKGWLEVAAHCGCRTPDECSLFAAPGDDRPDREPGLEVVQVGAGDCRRHARSPRLQSDDRERMI